MVSSCGLCNLRAAGDMVTGWLWYVVLQYIRIRFFLIDRVSTCAWVMGYGGEDWGSSQRLSLRNLVNQRSNGTQMKDGCLRKSTNL
jgi:hypothetical protein